MTALHLCLVTETYLPEVNGVANSLQRLLSHLNSDMFRVSIIRTSPKVDYPQAVNEMWVRGLSVPQYPDIQLGLPAGQRIRRAWKTDPPDIVYVATEGMLGASAVAQARFMSIPVISAFHTNFHRYSGYYGMAWIRSAVMAWMRRFHNRTDVTLVPSRALVKELTAERIDRVEWLPHGVDCEHFSPTLRCPNLRRDWTISGEALDDEIILLYVGRLAAEKNIAVALEAAEVARQQGFNLRMVVVGDGPMRAELEILYPYAVFAGVKTGRELAVHYASADVFLMPSQTETFGLVTLEAMASGLPVVAYNMAAAGECVRSSIDGYLAIDETAEAFRNALRQQLNSDSTLMGIDARTQAESMSWHTVARQFERRVVEIIVRQRESSNMVQPLQSPF